MNRDGKWIRELLTEAENPNPGKDEISQSGSERDELEKALPDYPKTKQLIVSETRFGISVPDPFRWLENDIRRDAEVAGWIGAQNELTTRYLSTLPGRDIFRDRLKALFDHERLSAPQKRSGRYFFTRHAGLEGQAVLYVRDAVGGNELMLIDPNQWSQDGSMAMAEWAPSVSGTHLAFAIQENGADWRTIRVLDLHSGELLGDEIQWARFTAIAWAGDGSGFFYSRNPAPAQDAAFETLVGDHAVYFHLIGTAQSEDRLVYTQQSEFPLIHTVDTTPDGRYVVIYSTALRGGNALSIIDLHAQDWTARSVIESFDSSWTLAGNIGSTFYLVTQEGAERGKLVTVNLADHNPVFIDLIVEKQKAVLRFASLTGDRIIATYMVDAKSIIERFRLDGTPDGMVKLPGVGTTGEVHGCPGDSEAFFVFTSHDTPSSVYRYDVTTNTGSLWARPGANIDLESIHVEQHFYRSKDGTRVPLFIVRRTDLKGPAPTMLTAYGGFGISLVPFYSPAIMAWVERGGVYAVANIRGGGEYGQAWHHAGRLGSKQNSYDDFIAAGDYLKGSGITTLDGLAIHGESNGGLLVAAAVNQRPDLFAAAIAGVGVMDMLRFECFTSGQFWVQEFGNPNVESDFRNLLSYSPLHNVKDGECYPAILVTTADTDDRVVPAHSFKYVAALQAADIGNKPHILRVEAKSGHGAGKPTAKAIEEIVDMWTFAACWIGLRIGV